MAETREITLTEENWQIIDELFAKIPDSDFLRFCLMNDIVEGGLKSFFERFKMDEKAPHLRTGLA